MIAMVSAAMARSFSLTFHSGRSVNPFALGFHLRGEAAAPW
jgi:hypothetical protein